MRATLLSFAAAAIAVAAAMGHDPRRAPASHDALAGSASYQQQQQPLLAGSDQQPQQLLRDVLAGSASDQRQKQQLLELQDQRRSPPLHVLAGSARDQQQQQLLQEQRAAGDQFGARLLAGQIPPHEQAARVARFVVHAVDWAALASLSARDPPGAGLPFATVFSVSDGPAGRHGNASGVPYMYLSSLDVSVKDIAADPRVSMVMTLASSHYCSRHVFDPQSPLCARVTFTGSVTRVVDEAEVSFARSALFSRHPEMSGWPPSHGWFFARLDIVTVWVVDYFGGPVLVSPKDYYNAQP